MEYYTTIAVVVRKNDKKSNDQYRKYSAEFKPESNIEAIDILTNDINLFIKETIRRMENDR